MYIYIYNARTHIQQHRDSYVQTTHIHGFTDTQIHSLKYWEILNLGDTEKNPERHPEILRDINRY